LINSPSENRFEKIIKVKQNSTSSNNHQLKYSYY
jgi:hypothetical protein